MAASHYAPAAPTFETGSCIARLLAQERLCEPEGQGPFAQSGHTAEQERMTGSAPFDC